MGELAAEKHVQYILSVEKRKDDFVSVVMEHLRMNGAYWGLTTLDLLGKLDTVDVDEVVSWVMKCQHESGGFGGNIGHDPHILYTLSALQVLALFDKLNVLDVDKVTNYIAGLQNEDGSFSGDIWGEVDTRFSYIAVCCLSILHSLNKINVEKAVSYIVSCKNLDGGFGCTPGGESHAGQIFCCVGALAIMGSLHHIDKDLLGWWLCERQVKSGGLNGRPEKLPDVCYSWWVLSSLIMIDKVHWINKEKLVKYILDCQDMENGGISDRPDDAVDVYHTFFGVAGLSHLEYPGLKAIDPAYALPVDVDELYKDRVKKVEEDVMSMINNENADLLETLELIDDVQRLGLGYRFEKDIRRFLENFASGCYNERVEKSLHATALSFRLLRQHGFEVSQDVFNSFKEKNGNFKECVGKDVKGMLSLYEASYLAFEGENLLDEAKAFTSMHLKDLKRDVTKSIEEQIIHALELPYHHRMQRLEARWYIESYGKKEDANRALLELAKLDFNIVQSVHQRELQDMSRWWKSMGLANRLSFARDRLMECFFWAVGMVYEPQFSHLRKGLTKVTALITTIDDVYDVYGTLDELVLFTDAVERWDINAIKTLPDEMKLCFLALYNTVNEMVFDTLKENGENILPYLTKAWADMLKAFLQEAKWSYNKEVPTFKDYLDNAWLSVSGVVILVHTYFLLNKTVTKQALGGLEKHHDHLRWPSIIFRLCNDLSTYAAELETGKTANSIHCYMSETSLSEKRACQEIRNMIDRTWKKMNEERLVDSSFGEPFVEIAINLARIAQCTYQHGDGHGAPDDKAKNRVKSLIIEPVLCY